MLQAHEIPLDGHVFYSGIMPEYKNTFRRMIQELQLCQYAYRDYTAGLFQMMLVLVSRQRQERRSINGTTREQIEPPILTRIILPASMWMNTPSPCT